MLEALLIPEELLWNTLEHCELLTNSQRRRSVTH